MDAGSKHVGLSATTEKEELYAAEIELRTDIVGLLATRRQNRRTRRNRLRYRPARFDNRVHSKNKGWLAPSIEQKIQSHLKAVEDVHKLLPISKIIVETASFDIQKIKAPDIAGKTTRKANSWVSGMSENTSYGGTDMYAGTAKADPGTRSSMSTT